MRGKPRLGVEGLESRLVPAVTAALGGGVLAIVGDAANDNIRVQLDAPAGQLVVRSFGLEAGRFANAAVTSIVIDAGAGSDVVRVDPDVAQVATVQGGDGKDILFGGAGQTTLNGGDARDKLRAGSGTTVLSGDAGPDRLFNVKPVDTAVTDPTDTVQFALPIIVTPPAAVETLNTAEVARLLDRAAAATPSTDGIIAIVDRNGRLLGLRTEAGVDPALLATGLGFAADGAISLARTGAFFANNQAPLTSRTVQFISQTTMTQREIESNPSIPDNSSIFRGPGFVAPIGIKNHFPPGVPFTPQVDLFAIEHTNRDSLRHPGADGIKGTGDDQTLAARFNINPLFVSPGQGIFAPEAYDFLVGANIAAQSRGIGTLPGGIPIFKNGQLVGGIGVFYPGRTGFASESNSALDAKYDPGRPDRALEAEYAAFAAVNGTAHFTPGTISGFAPVAGVGLPSGRIDLVGITLDIFGPGGTKGTDKLFRFGQALGQGASTGANRPVAMGGVTLQDGLPVPEGWLVNPHDGDGITAAEVTQIINAGIQQATTTRA
ncbi:MAG: hypothetical protein K2W96_18530, partial [Gemmataceae bacterium]|nr:hypothetical protein [Gemmataceae bacterium]